ncbi:MAG: CarD family transcriptional regulator [Pseudobutyrivibrio sp.]|nr:CarD family transcriptional regulator [Pseudobutyrivibrio sp.]
MSFKVGDYVVHEGSGVCQIEDIDDMELMGKGSRKTYYCMAPVYKAGAKVFTPVDGSSAKLRPVTALDKVNNIIEHISDIDIINESNDRVRQEVFKETMAQFTIESMASVVKTAFIRKCKRIDAGKKVMAQDEKVLNVAGRKLYEEMAFAMGSDIIDAQKRFEDAIMQNISNGALIGA